MDNFIERPNTGGCHNDKRFYGLWYYKPFEAHVPGDGLFDRCIIRIGDSYWVVDSGDSKYLTGRYIEGAQRDRGPYKLFKNARKQYDVEYLAWKLSR